MDIYVNKADGSKQLFDRKKVVKTCLRMGANREIAKEIAEKVEEILYDGISTDKILQVVFKLLRRYKPIIKHLFDLRKGLSLMNSRPEFELFVQELLGQNGYEVEPNQIIRGRCIEHEVDAVAKKDDITYFVEAKHHSNYHTPTGLDESRIARATLEDVIEGFKLGLNDIRIERAMIITNTRFSKHARRYGECRNILQIGWSSPPDHSLQDIIEENRLYPFTCLRNLGKATRRKLVSARIVFLKQLVEEDPDRLAGRVGVSKKIIKNIIEKARDCSYNIYHI